MPNAPESRRRITLNDNGPWLVEGPVEVTGTDGTNVASDRFTVAICTCRAAATSIPGATPATGDAPAGAPQIRLPTVEGSTSRMQRLDDRQILWRATS